MNLNERRAKEAEEAILEVLSCGKGLTAQEIAAVANLGLRRTYRALGRLLQKGTIEKRGTQFFRSYKAESNNTVNSSVGLEKFYQLLRRNFELGVRDAGLLPEEIDLEKQFHTFLAKELGLPPILPPNWSPPLKMRAVIKATALAYSRGLQVGMTEREAYKQMEYSNSKSSTSDYVDYWAIIFGGADNSQVR